MNQLNSVILEGNLTKEPDQSYTPKGSAVTHFPIASNRYFKQDGERQEEVGYYDIETWGRLAETCAEYLKKGRGVRVVGRLKQDRWQQNGKSRSKVVIVAEHVEFRSSTPNMNEDEYAHAG
jgi:single-strand DNA-binding protein